MAKTSSKYLLICTGYILAPDEDEDDGDADGICASFY